MPVQQSSSRQKESSGADTRQAFHRVSLPFDPRMKGRVLLCFCNPFFRATSKNQGVDGSFHVPEAFRRDDLNAIRHGDGASLVGDYLNCVGRRGFFCVGDILRGRCKDVCRPDNVQHHAALIGVEDDLADGGRVTRSQGRAHGGLQTQIGRICFYRVIAAI